MEVDHEDKKRQEKAISVLATAIVYVVLGAMFWPLAINPWLVFFGKSAKVVWWHGALLGCIHRTRHWCVMAAIFTAFAIYLLED